ncbi:hypothetical protein A3D78_00870 [Candidatus Gottesmanbacteria bacterium RIFCSPHIGHO2_02_FULL_39_14]|uniref:Diacylglycerol kinase n=3 Tax=Candidatus Gottesmaniibacteriota TaxID=1752720 RepID=A0A1F6A061_9BACT|nr:MAG: hypothetical protein A2153_03480 [Candidatus Gottesmanbacteria bacterium RBG_16_38_7b]OGG18033.1 MAG: hypothetical protein A3D78_00870 [Candidatus Gottesmanbacteria bacterium RIFCSPHIGHO2_02_FULL_39_14]OGG31034.1 MAG: hypothetical protein A3I51_00325 [Candidatus Gottesmanbacteria bacterium RIFCSPLOWO2_02_FULL_38_8]
MPTTHQYFLTRLKHYHLSFKNALRGINWALSTQQNFKIHLSISALVLLFAFLLEISRLEMLLLIICIVFGLGAEMINTAVEAMTDLITNEWKKEAKIAKDISAGMVLVMAIGTVIIGLSIFLPKLITLYFNIL